MPVMNFTEPYRLAMREQDPKMFMELRRAGRLDQHLREKSEEAQAMFNNLLKNDPNPGLRERREAEEIVRATLIDFPEPQAGPEPGDEEDQTTA